MVLFSILKLLLGLAFFLFGMSVMSANLGKLAGGKLEQLLKTMTANPLVSMALGAVITIAVQSSSAVTVMLVGLVNSGIMNFTQTLYVIFGANIGTTLTGWILSLSGIQSTSVAISMLKPENFSPILAIIGVIMIMASKGNERRNSIGTILMGFTILMYGMVVMSNAVSPLADTPQFKTLLVQFNQPLVALLISCIFTAIIQSSAATVGIMQALSLTGAITFQMAIPIVMGLNIGTCATSLLSCIGTKTHAKRVAVTHFVIKVIGAAICLPIYLALESLFRFSFAGTATSPVSIALLHTIYNIIITIILVPFTKLLVRLARLIVPEKVETQEHINGMTYAPDLLLLRSPSIALHECNQYTFRMARMAKDSIDKAIGLLDEFIPSVADEVAAEEDHLDLYEDRLDTYLVYLSSKSLSQEDSRYVGKMQRGINDMERLGDHAVNVMKAAKELDIKSLRFSNMAVKELKVLTDAVRRILDITTECYVNTDVNLALQVEPLEEVIDDLTDAIKDRHLERLQKGFCTVECGFILNDLLTDFERISDHCSNMAVSVIEVNNDNLNSHELLWNMKQESTFFKECYARYCEEYALPQ